MADRDEAIARLCSATGVDSETAEMYLAQNAWNVEAAANSLMMDQEESGNEEAAPSAPSASSASRSITHPKAATAASSSSSKPTQKKTFGSFGDLKRQEEEGEDDDDDDKEQEFFAGGDKSALAVQDPSQGSRDHVRRLLETARRNGPPPPREEPRASNFRGSGQTLGDDDTPSRTIPDASANQPRQLPMVERTLHLWADGFSVDDGPLYRYDDPANARTLDMINRGSAPLNIMNVENGQAVDVKLEQHPGDNYVEPKKKFQAFSGSGQRLGSPTPGPSGAAPVSASAASSAPAPAAAPPAHTASAPSTNVDESQPTITLQIRLADGTRLPSRFNASQTVGDVYSFVSRANASSQGRAYTLATTFPTKDLSEESQVLGDLAELKRGGVVVQKWT